MKDIEKLLDKPHEETFENDWLKTFQSDNFDLNPIGFNQAFIQFHVRFATDEEMEACFKRMRELLDLPEDEQKVKLFDIYKDCLIKFSTRTPSFTLNGEAKTIQDEKGEVINRLFPKYNTKGWKVLQKAWLDFRAANEPEVNFK